MRVARRSREAPAELRLGVNLQPARPKTAGHHAQIDPAEYSTKTGKRQKTLERLSGTCCEDDSGFAMDTIDSRLFGGPVTHAMRIMAPNQMERVIILNASLKVYNLVVCSDASVEYRTGRLLHSNFCP